MKEKKIKILWSLVMVISLFLLQGGIGYASVSGPCVDCHTMHNSQGGAEMATFGGETGANSALVRGSCMGCHTGTTDPLDDTNAFPYVKSSSSSFSDDLCLAGGFFPITPGMGDNNDNHHGMGNTNDPAGLESGSFYTQGSIGLSCAGINGCHGNETDTNDMTAISGGHHNPSAYRILYVGTDPVVGSGAKDYEEAIIDDPATIVVTTVGDTQNVNHYSAGVDDPSISELCAKCHGDFHNESGTTVDVGSSGAWIRHPTDVAIPTEWDIASTGYELNGDDYKHNPVGYDNATFQATTGRRATCLSCHRAHGTANNDLLRWVYNDQDAGSGLEYGCLGCHDKQR